ncbi:MAG: FliH/SctL family protein [Planctomycetaceae bacterium]|nr:FliH/SctL family protein [Planctomycetaceae bacterium]
MIDSPATTPPVIFKPVTFNFVDLQTKAEEYLAKIKAEAREIMEATRNGVAKLREEIQIEQKLSHALAEKSRLDSEALQKRLTEETEVLDKKRKEVETQAYQTGYELGQKEGYDEGRKTGYADGELQASLDHDAKVKQEVQILLAGRLETLLPALQSAVQQLETAQQSFLLLWEQSAVHVASAIAQRAIGRQLPEMIEVPLRLLREALELAVGCSQMKIRLNPTDYETLEPQIQILIDELSGAAKTEIFSDVRITRGGCLLETSLGTIDQQIESRLERIEMELVSS